ncbi:hypothetical protein AVEN_230808-1 [Araneus ventricosus]|uniref:Uncharacterized protein n=1 Tax=Araneus ventricosus TaxID=182803 RepID=A0A4Y2A3A5_ARAVE|nr:hypothetical protein AVEN_230808-1 [Araneus ventricosus]
MWHNIYQSLEDSSNNIIPGFNDGGLQFCHRLKPSAIGIYSTTEEIRGKDRPFHDMHPIIQKSFPGGFCNVNDGVVVLENPALAPILSANASKWVSSISC